MAKGIVGIDIGAGHVKMAVCNDGGIVQAAIEDMPDNLVKDGRITSLETMSEVLRSAARNNRVTTKNCALVLHSHDVFTRRIALPAMTVDELRLNIPFEFKDYIADGKDKYCFDYAVLDTKRNEAGDPSELDLLAVAAPTATIHDYATMVKRAGFKLVCAAPDIMAYAHIVAAYQRRNAAGDTAPASAPAGMGAGAPAGAGVSLAATDFCFLDIGYDSTRVYLYPQGNYEVTRSIETGIQAFVAAVADYFSVDFTLAKTYLKSNYEGAQSIQPCLDLYERLAVEVGRIVSFFGFNYPESQLEVIHYCGSGAEIAPLVQMIGNHVSVDVRDICTIMPPARTPIDNLSICAAAAGITMQ